MESKVKTIAVVLLCATGATLFFFALAGLDDLFFSAHAFRLHHEATTVLCEILANCAGGLLCGFVILVLVGKGKTPTQIHELGAWIFLILMLIGAKRVLANEAFFTLFDNKSIPVHPTRIVMHPLSGWMTVSDHLMICFLGIVAGAAFLFFSRNRKKAGG